MIPTILESEHDSKVAGHFGQEKTIELVRRNFWWPGMDTDITEYIQACPDCQRDKSRRHRRYGLLSPLELPHAPWQSTAMDFITDLPRSNGCTELWVVIDRFSKMAHFIPLRRQKLFLPRCVTGGYIAYGNPRWARKQKTTCPVLGRLWEVHGEATGNHPTHGAHRDYGAHRNHGNQNCRTMDACSSFN